MRVGTLTRPCRLFSPPTHNWNSLDGEFLTICGHSVTPANLSLMTSTLLEISNLCSRILIIPKSLHCLFLGFFVPNTVQEFASVVIISVLPHPPQESPPPPPNNNYDDPGQFALIPLPHCQVHCPEASNKGAKEEIPKAVAGVSSPSEHYIIDGEAGFYQIKKGCAGCHHGLHGGGW